MKALRRGDVYFFVWIMMCSVIIFLWPTGRSTDVVHSMSVDPNSVSVEQPIQELYRLAVRDGMTNKEWKIFWRGSLTLQEKESFLQWLKESDSFLKKSERTTLTPHGIKVREQKWRKTVQGKTHQIQIIYHPQEKQRKTNYIYTWSGTEMDATWSTEYDTLESHLLTQVQEYPETFALIKGVAHDQDLMNIESDRDHVFKGWITDDLKGETTHRVSDYRNYISINGYVSAWENRIITDGNQKMNVQLSARYNALDGKTRVAIGYPLILTEH